MKIVIATGIYPPEGGGPATYAHGIALALRQDGHEVTVVAYGEEQEREKGVKWVSRRGGPFLRYLRYAWRVFCVARRADVVYAMGPVSEGLPATLGAALAGRPVVMKVVGDYAWEMAMQKNEAGKWKREGRRAESGKLLDDFLMKKHGGIIGLYERIERWTARRARRMIVPSNYLKTVVEKWGVSRDRIDVIINATQPLARIDREQARKNLSVSDETVILYVGRAVPWKGVGELIALWKRLPETHVFVVAGNGPELESWRRLAEKEGVSKRVKFLGRTDRATTTRWFNAADALALNSGYEGWPHVVAEAVSLGVPCLVSDKGGNPETRAMYGEVVTVLPYQDETAWVEALSRVDRLTMPRPVTVTWSFDDMKRATLDVLRETIGERAEGRIHAVMLSYDRALLDEQSDVFQRVSSIAQGGMNMTALVLPGVEKDAITPSEDGSFRVMGFGGMGLSRVWKVLREGIRAARLLPGRTVITAQDPFIAGVIGYIISRVTNVPLEIQEHGDFFSGYWTRESWKHRALSCLGKFILRRAERVRAVSERVKADLIRHGISSNKIDVIPVAQNLDQLLAKPLSVWKSGRPRMIAPARFVKQKGLDVLIEAASLLAQEGVPFELHLIGSGPEEEDLRGQIAARGLSNRVVIEPWKNAAALWNDADLFVMSSRYEGWGRTIVEAMAAGVPVVTTDAGCVGSFLRPQIDGRVVQPNDASALAAAIREQINEPERREAMRASARLRAATFASQAELHEKQRMGWRHLVIAYRLLVPTAVSGRPTAFQTGPRFELWAAAFLVFAIASRLASVWLFHESLAQREWGFFHLVDNWFNGFGYSYAAEPGCASAYRSPGFLFFLTALYGVFSPSNTLAQALVQNLVVVGVLWLVYAVGKRLVGKRAALLGAFLMAIYPYTFYHYTQYYHTFLSSFFLLLIVWFLLRLAESRRLIYAIGTGLSIGALAYVQGTILPATPFIVGWLLYRFWPDWRLAFKAALIMAVCSAGLIAPWTYRNWKELHAFVPLTTDLGHALFKANNEIIYDLTQRGYPQEIVDEITVSSTNPNYKQYRVPLELEEQMRRDGTFRESIYWTEWHPKEPNGKVSKCSELGPLTEVEFNRYWTEKAQGWMKENWFIEGWKLQLLKLKTFWQPNLFPSVKTGAVWSFAGSPLKVWLARNAVALASAVVIFGGWLGMALAIRRRDKNVWLPMAIMVVYSVMHTFFAGYTKYRIPLDNLLAPYAAWVIMALWDAWRGKNSQQP